MATKINIAIPQPCHENWEAMTTVDKGKFCASCQKNVFDFTTASDREIINAFEKNNNLCGRFLNTQLNRDLVKPKEKSSLWLATTTALISLFGINEVSSQEKAPTEQTDKSSWKKTSNQETQISGVVSDKIGPLPGANVSIKGTQKFTATDFDGKFTIKAIKGDILVFSFVGMQTKEITVDENFQAKDIILQMNQDEELSDLVITVGAIVKKRNFLGRMFHKSKYK